jgi:hypothetical protein
MIGCLLVQERVPFRRAMGKELDVGGSGSEDRTNDYDTKITGKPDTTRHVLTVEWWDVLQTHLLSCTINTK